MAKAPKKRMSPIFWVGLFSIAVAAYVLTTPEEVKRKPTKRSSTKSSRDTRSSIVLPADYKAHFNPVLVPAKNAFKPLVARRSKPVGAAAEGGKPTAVPSDFAGGKTTWRYTGMATIDGVPNALLENSVTGDSQFVRPGQRWQMATIVRISPEALVLRGASGNETMIARAEEEAPPEIAPATPGNIGTIGGPQPLTVQPMAGEIGAPAGQDQAGRDQGRAERRERRRNRNQDGAGGQ